MVGETLSERVVASGGLRPAIRVIEDHITELLNSCVDYIEEKNIPADTSHIDELKSIFYGKKIGDLSKITPNQVRFITHAYFKGKGLI